MPKYTVSRDTHFSSEEVFSVAADVDSYKEFLPLVRESRTYDRKKEPDGRESFKGEIRVRYKKLNTDNSFTSQVTLDRVRRTISSVAIEGPFEHMKSQWAFRDRKAGGSTIEFTIDYKLKSRTLQFLLSGMFDMANRKILSAFESRAEQLYGGKTARSA
jgi:coenzyme Q-binding protein COQ10